jgi:predicted unusual protein kinase regulating ubiquinone biosynthesis (AarF/ABC1/UbiB family)
VRTAMFKMCFDDGFPRHLHPGNMFLRDNGQLVIIDVGL